MKLLHFLLLAIYSAPLLSHSTAAATLEEAAAQAVSSNPEVQASIKRRRAADASVQQAQGGYWPRVDLSAGVGRERVDNSNSRLFGLSDTAFTTRDKGLTVTQMLFDGFAVSSTVSRERARVAASAYGVASTAERVALQTVGAYLEVLRREETMAAARENLSAHQRIYDMIRRRAESGVGRRADLDQAESRLALAQASLRAEASSLRDAEAAYTRVVGAPPVAASKPVPAWTAWPASEQEVVDASVSNHPAIKAAKADFEAAEAQEAVAKSAFSPRLDLELNTAHGDDRLNGKEEDYTALLRLRYNLFSGGADRAKVRQSAYQIQETREIMAGTQREIEEAALQAYNAFLTARDRNVFLRQYVTSSAATREAYAKQFSIGQRTLLDLLNSENEYLSARTAYITGVYAELASQYRVFASMGRLLEALHIVLPVEGVAAYASDHK